MKLRNNITAIFICLSFPFICSCGRMEDTYEKFIGDGEVNYIAKADSLKLSSGYGRVQLSWLLPPDPKIDSYKVFWNNRSDSVMNSITNSTDTIKVIIDGLEERAYTFTVFMYDKDGVSSVPSDVTGSVFGDNYVSALAPRAYNSLEQKENEFVIKWGAPNDELRGVRVDYTDTHGISQSVFTGRSSEETILPDFPKGGDFLMRSIYTPTESVLDTPYVDKKMTVKKDRVTVDFAKYTKIIAHFKKDFLYGIDEKGNIYLIRNGADIIYSSRPPAEELIGSGADAFGVFQFDYVHNVLVGQRVRNWTIQQIPFKPDGSLSFNAMRQIGSGWNNLKVAVGDQGIFANYPAYLRLFLYRTDGSLNGNVIFNQTNGFYEQNKYYWAIADFLFIEDSDGLIRKYEHTGEKELSSTEDTKIRVPEDGKVVPFDAGFFIVDNRGKMVCYNVDRDTGAITGPEEVSPYIENRYYGAE
ncbi:fibronectin type III domain protein [Phocaeicola abscessus]|uniref:fibronectin type III domain protein n=1 Tax=Phocaeicola abscessus TaxID=555313 RepID=UPI000385ADDE|nr:fibronectin type III domain protein [Phocaeicola abscessus]EPT33970.1 fibronectin type III domain protein [Bacteroidetes bacterium oral taxon 272 str. F0290]